MNLLSTARQDYQEKKYQEAVNLYKTMIEQEPQNGSFHQGLAQSLYKLGQYDSAMEEVHRALQLNSDLAEAHTTLGLIYYRRRQYEESKVELQKALELDSNQADPYIAIGAIALIEHNFQRSIDVLQKAIALNPKSFEAHYNLRFAYSAIKAHKEAYQEIRIAYKLNPSYKVGILVILEQEYFIRFWLILILCLIYLGPLVTRLIYILPLMIIFAVYNGVIGFYFFQSPNKRSRNFRIEVILSIIVSFVFWYISKGL